jgi:hypothetical protein
LKYYSTDNPTNEQAWRDGTAKSSTGANMKDGPWVAADYTQSGEFVNDKVGYSGGGTPVPPTPVPTPGPTPVPGGPQVNILYLCYEINPTGINAIRPWFEVRNDTTSSIALSDVKIRYSLNKDGTSGTLTYMCDYAQVGNSNITGTPVQKLGEEYYFEIGFTTGAGSLAAGANSGPIQIRIYTTTYANFNQSNDYSFNPAMTNYGLNTNIAGFYQGTLVFGSEAP